MGLLRAAVPGSPLLMLQYSFSLHIVVSDGELKAGGSYPHRVFGSPVASARCEVHMLHVRWSRRAVPCQELALLFVSVSFKIGVSPPNGWPFGRTTFDSTVDSLRASRQPPVQRSQCGMNAVSAAVSCAVGHCSSLQSLFSHC